MSEQKAIRDILWVVGEDLLSLDPCGVQDAGVQGEHHATKVTFRFCAAQTVTVNGESKTLGRALENGELMVQMEHTTAYGEWDLSEPLTCTDWVPPGDEAKEVSYLLPEAWTQHGGEASIRLVFSREGELVAYTGEGRVRYKKREGLLKRVRSVIEQSIWSLLESCRAAVAGVEETADKVTGEMSAAAKKAAADIDVAMDEAVREAATYTAAAEAAAEKAETKVESIYERNKKLPVSLWVGTQEEYDAIEEKEPNRLYIVGEDEPLAALQSRMAAIENTHTRATYKSITELGVTTFPTTMSAVVAAMPAYSMLMMDTRHIKNTTEKDIGDQIISDWGNDRNGIAIIMKGKDNLRVSLMVVHSSGTATTTALDYGNYAGYSDVVNWNTTSPADYVMEQGTKDAWVYRKWNSGLYECWGSFAASSVDVTTAWGALYRSDGGLVSGEYPIAFVGHPHVTVAVQRPFGGIGDTAAFLIPHTAGTNTTPPDYNLCHANALTGINANLRMSVIGYWK